MEQINNFIEAIKQKELIDVLIAIGIIILFYIMRNVFSNMIIKIFKVKGSEKQKLKNSETSKGLKTIFICIGVYIALNNIDSVTAYIDIIPTCENFKLTFIILVVK